MSEFALGLVETRGLIGAIEATDAAAKAAEVVVSTVELTDAAYLTLKIEGELGAVQAAVEAAARAVEKVGELVAVWIIPRPDDGLDPIMPHLRYISKYHPEENRPPLRPAFDNPGSTASPARPKRQPPPTAGKRAERAPRPTAQKLDRMTVSELRVLARTIANLPIQGREISRANKQQLIDAIRSVTDRE